MLSCGSIAKGKRLGFKMKSTKVIGVKISLKTKVKVLIIDGPIRLSFLLLTHYFNTIKYFINFAAYL